MSINKPNYKKLKAYIFRSWKEEPKKVDRRLQILPPFILEILSYLIALSILVQIAMYFIK
jgi:hypothetical protein